MSDRSAAQRASEKTSLPADSTRILSRNSSSWGLPAVVGWILMGVAACEECCGAEGAAIW